MKIEYFKQQLRAFLDNFFKKLLTHLPRFWSYSDAIFILRTDNIGDYVLFRNFLPVIRHSEKYQQRKIILIGNAAWRELAEQFDSAFIDRFIWIDVGKYNKSRWYKYAFWFKIWRQKPLEIVNTVHSHIKITNELTLISKAKFRTTCLGDAINLIQPVETLNKSTAYYNQIINSLPNIEFEFFRNKAFVQNWLNEVVTVARTSFNSVQNKQINPELIGIFIGATSIHRRWRIEHFAHLINGFHQHFPSVQIEIYGGKLDFTEGGQLVNLVTKKDKISNLCGKTRLSELVTKIATCRLLISNETSAVHIAAAVDTSTVCIANGERFGRFSPYPRELNTGITTIFPDISFYLTENHEQYTHQFQYVSTIDINTITPQIVLPIVLSKWSGEIG